MHTLPTGIFAALVVLSIDNADAQNQFANWESPHAHPLELTADGRHLIAVNTPDQRIEVFELDANGIPQKRGAIVVGVEPVSVRARDNDQLWVVNHLSDSISIVELGSARVRHTIHTGDEPVDVVFAGTPTRAFTTISQRNRIEIRDPAAPDTLLANLPVQGEEPRALTVSADRNRVYVALFESGNATTIIEQADVSNPAGPYAGRNPPPNRGTTFDPPLIANLPAPPAVAQIVRRDASGRWRDDNGADWSSFVSWNLHDHDVAVVDANSLATTYVSSVMTHVMALGVAPDGRLSVVGTEALNQLRFEPNVQGIFIRAQLALIDSTPAATQIQDLNPQLDYSQRSVAPALRQQAIGDPRAIVWHPDGQSAYVSGMGSNNVIVVGATGNRIGRIDVGAGPTGLALNADGTRLYVLNHFDSSISTIDTATNQELARNTMPDPTPAAVRAGRPLLYDTHAGSGLGQASCASCHIDGRSDFLAWDLGNPQGAMKDVNQPCRQGQTCRPWHPLKGPLVTQSLQGIVGNGAMHWRGDRENIAAFAAAYVSLQAADAEPDATQMQAFEQFLGALRYPPNPNRNIDGSYPAALPVTGGNGNPAAGETLFLNLPTLAGNTPCVGCHALPSGTSRQIDDPMLALAPQSMKQAQLRGLWEKVGWSTNSQNNAKGFGFNSDSEFDSLNALLLAGFNFGGPALAPQRRRDVEAYLLAFDSETPAAVGQQITFADPATTSPDDIALLQRFSAIADTGSIGLIAHGRYQGQDHGWVYVTNGIMQSDREHAALSTQALREAAADGAEITFTVVAAFTQYRSGVDRDADGYFDRDERDLGSDETRADSIAASYCRPDVTDDGTLDEADNTLFLARFAAGDVLANYDHSLSSDGRPEINAIDLQRFQADVAQGCADALFRNGFEANAAVP